MVDGAAAARGDIPGPGGPEMLANIRLMRRRPPEFLAQCARGYGPVVRFPIPKADVVLITDPADVRRVLQANHTAYGKGTLQYDTLALVTGSGLLASDADVWRRMRRLLSPAFHRETVDGMAGRISSVSSEWVRRNLSAESTEIDLDDAMLDLSLSIVSETLLGVSFSGRAELIEAVSEALRIVVARAQPLTLGDWPPTSGKRRLDEAIAVVDAAVEDLASSRRSQPPGADALWLLIEALDQGVVSAREVRDEIVTLIVAGHETVAATLTWTWYLLAQHPQVERRVQREADALPGPETWNANTLASLTYTSAVIDECLRLYPPAWVITRRSLEPDVLSGYSIPAGATVIMSPYVTHRDARWWPEPRRFDADRFGAGPQAGGGGGPLTYFPFGAGPRQCIGRELALLELPLMVAALASKALFRPLKPASVTPDFGVTLRPKGGLPATMVLRSQRVRADGT